MIPAIGNRRYKVAQLVKSETPMLKKMDDAYSPINDEPFMNQRQREYFRNRLLVWRDDIIAENRETLETLQSQNENHADLADRATAATGRSAELRSRDRESKLIAKINLALRRIDVGTYGYCEETGEPISLRRTLTKVFADTPLPILMAIYA